MNTRSKTRNSISSNSEKSQMTSDSNAPRASGQRQAKKQAERQEELQQNTPSQVATNEVYDAPVEGEFLKSSYQ
ncbi:hypothetical protein K7432_003423 [Basidiobolus ranarum]|uniref:Uncharacterized protein n=1 Tax=Basidiobolus ranarum TaxID=34480 RepID=A0ABR2W6G8_9FUNG